MKNTLPIIISLLLTGFFGISCNSNSQPEKGETNIIQTVQQKMQEQENCWNQGDLECFMQHYWHSDSLRFIGGKGLTFGWQTTLDNYKTSYPDKSTMGKLKFTNEIEEIIDDNTIQIIGEWELFRNDTIRNAGGHYSLLWQRKAGEWVIISDHSS